MYEKIGRKEKFLLWLHRWSSDKLHTMYSGQDGIDMKCPYCHEWFSWSRRYCIGKIKDSKVKGGVIIWTCGNCQRKSYWLSGVIPGMLRCDKRGNVL